VASLTAAQRLDLLLSEDPEAVIARERSTLENMIGSLDDPFVLFGAGNLGRKALATLDSIGKRPVAFIDNNPQLWGTEYSGVPIMSPADAARRFGPRELGVITTIWCGEATDKMSDRIGPLRTLGYDRIAHFGHLAWKFASDFLPHYSLDLPSRVIERATDVRRAFSHLADEESRELYVNHMEWRLWLNYDALPEPTRHSIYFDEHFATLSAEEILFDIGAFTGDSIESFLHSRRGLRFKRAYCFEPSPANFSILSENVERIGSLRSKVTAHELALGEAEGLISVEAEGGPSARVGHGSSSVRVSTVDRFSELHEAPTFIKMDIEGHEPSCLRGAERVIRSKAPVVAVCVYHEQSHLWEILLQLQSYRPDYRFTLGAHLADGWDLVLYAVPPERAPNS